MTLPGQATPSGRRESPHAACHQQCPKPPALFFLSLAHPYGSQPISLTAPPLGEEWQWGTSISKQLRVGHIYLSLGAGPFFRPLPSKMCLLLELLPLNTQFPWELSSKKGKKKKKS